MKNNRKLVFSNSLIWFGAGVSIAEILTGSLIAPLGFGKGVAAILLGHTIGCVLLFFSGLIGERTGKSAMEAVKQSFGGKGASLFASLNVLQLVGWTAVMIVSGAAAANTVLSLGGNGTVWCVIIGALIILWLLIGIGKLDRLNIAAMAALFVLCVILSVVIFGNSGAVSAVADTDGGMPQISFGAAVELSAAMPLSWLPLISDYTRRAHRSAPKNGIPAVTTASTAVYFAVSSWMYIIGLGATVLTGESDIAAILLKSGLGLAAVIIVIFSTVTTTFLDTYSAGVSSTGISQKMKERPAAIAVCIIGVVLAIFTPVTQFENFLYLIGSVFAPMIAIQIADFFILRKDNSGKHADIVNLIIWLAGFILYRLFMAVDTPVGNTLPVMLITGALVLIVNKIIKPNGTTAKVTTKTE